jgi:hypothetical protein
MNYNDKFIEFWQLYPKRKSDSKSKTYKKWNKLKLDDNFDEVMKAVKTYIHYKEVKQGYGKGATVWLNQRMYETITENEIPTTSKLTESGADEQTLKIIIQVINPLIEFYGEPDWYSNGRNNDSIINKWAGALSKFEVHIIKKGLEDLFVSRTYSNFPPLSEVFKYINKYSYMQANSHTTILQEASDWYEQNFIDNDEELNLCMTAKYKTIAELIKTMAITENINNYSFAKIIEELWLNGTIQNEFNSLYIKHRQLLTTKSKSSKVRYWLRKLFIKAKQRREYDLSRLND